jgi:hypothetical protein
LLINARPEFDMAIDAQKLRSHPAATEFLRAPSRSTPLAPRLQLKNPPPLTVAPYNVFLLHHGADGDWIAQLAHCLRSTRSGNSYNPLSLAVVNEDSWTSALLDATRSTTVKQTVIIVISKPMLRDGKYLSESIADVFKGLAAAGKRVVTILKDNVTIPPSLRLSEWFDFRNENQFEDSVSELTTFLSQNCSQSTRPYSLGVIPAKERILSNLFPVVEVPKFVFSYETSFKSDSEVAAVCAEAGPLPFLLKNRRIYMMECLSPNSPFAGAVAAWDTRRQEDFTQWFSDRERSAWGIEMLNKLFRRHAWKRGLRWDISTNQFFFPRNKPKSIWWEIGGQTVSREVTAPHTEWISLENDARAEVQYGWKHQSVRADFLNVRGNLYLCLEQCWMLTKLDSKTPATTQPVAPVFPVSQSPKRNGQILRSWRFWSTVLSKGHNEIRINTGQAPVRTRLTPMSGFTQFGISSDCTDYDQLMQDAMDEDLLMPELKTADYVIR